MCESDTSEDEAEGDADADADADADGPDGDGAKDGPDGDGAKHDDDVCCTLIETVAWPADADDGKWKDFWAAASGMPAEGDDTYNNGNPVAGARIGICMPKIAHAGFGGNFKETGPIETTGAAFVKGTTAPPEGKTECDDECLAAVAASMESTVEA